jgi:hypothetical protein
MTQMTRNTVRQIIVRAVAQLPRTSDKLSEFVSRFGGDTSCVNDIVTALVEYDVMMWTDQNDFSKHNLPAPMLVISDKAVMKKCFTEYFHDDDAAVKERFHYAMGKIVAHKI